MARSIKEIQQRINDRLKESQDGLSESSVAEWRLWTHIQAVAIHTFELILDQFRREIDADADKITPGTVRWYAEQSKRFQYEHELLFDRNTAQLYYAQDDPQARIIAVVGITEYNNRLNFKVAKEDQDGNITELTPDELYAFDLYIDNIKFAGILTNITSNRADTVHYDMTVYHDSAKPASVVKQNVIDALNQFRITLDFDSLLYKQQLIDAAMHADGVVTVQLNGLGWKDLEMEDYIQVGAMQELTSGYFDYDPDCEPACVAIKTKK